MCTSQTIFMIVPFTRSTARSGSIALTRKLLHCANRDVGKLEAQPSSWLNDDVCNFYLAMLQQSELTKNPNQPKVFFFNTFFYGRLYAHTEKYDFESVSRWLKKFNFSILDCETLVVPIHKNNNHWVSVLINMKGVSLKFLDSAGGDDDKALVRAHVCAGRFLVPRVARSFYRTCVLAPHLAVLGPCPSWASAEAGNWTNGTGLSRLLTYPCRKSSSSTSSTSMRPKRSRFSRGGRMLGAVSWSVAGISRCRITRTTAASSCSPSLTLRYSIHALRPTHTYMGGFHHPLPDVGGCLDTQPPLVAT